MNKSGDSLKSGGTKFFIYSLVDCISKEILYIGCTSNPSKRRKEHFGNSEFKKVKVKGEYISGLIKDEMWPHFNIICSFDNKEIALSMERTLIKKIHPKLNIKHNGGVD